MNNKLNREDILKLCEKWQKEIRVQIKQIQIRKMKKKWGSCSTKGILTLNQELLNYPVKYVEYVIVHELLHLIVPNHGKTFKTLLYVYLPNWEECHKYLMNKNK
jgi:predicted metal-dependent hydrolase